MSRRLERSAATILTALAAVVLMIVGAPAAWASPSATPTATPKVDCVVVNPNTGACDVLGVVNAVAHIGDRTYIGGSFTSIDGVPRSNVAAIRADGTLDPTWNPSTDGVVYALAAARDGSKVFIGGGFTTVGGQARSRLAAVDPVTGAPLANWTTTVNNNLVRSLAVDSADRLYVGGSFARIGGRDIPRLAAVSQTTGAVVTSFVPRPNGTVRVVTLSDDGTRVYTGGGFTAIGGQARRGAAELLATNGTATAFAPSDGGVVIAMDVSPSGRLYFGTTSNRLWAYDPVDGGVPEYRIRTGGDVQVILAFDDEVYIGGHFTSIPEQKLNRARLASFRPVDGAMTAWNPGTNGFQGIWAITRAATSAGTYLTIGGDFTRVAGLARRGVARFLF
jgi:hypothetical protein